MIHKSFWQNKNVLITGHTGFKGSWLALWLLKKGAKVSGISLEPNTKPSLFDQLSKFQIEFWRVKKTEKGEYIPPMPGCI